MAVGSAADAGNLPGEVAPFAKGSSPEKGAVVSNSNQQSQELVAGESSPVKGAGSILMAWTQVHSTHTQAHM